MPAKAGNGASRGTRGGSAIMTSLTPRAARRSRTGSMTSGMTQGSSTSAPITTPRSSPRDRSAAGGTPPARTATRTRRGCWSPAMPAAPAGTGPGPGKRSWPGSRPRPGWRSRSATSRPARNAVACQLRTIVSLAGGRGCMMAGMHPWTGLSDDVRLGVLTEWVTAGLVDEVLAECGKRDQRPGALPARFMVYYVLALALFQPDSYDDVAENLVGALEGMGEAIPARSSFTRARQRLGAGVIEAVFRRLAGPVAPAGLDGAFWRGMRVAAVDGFLPGVPDTPANRAAFGGPVAARGQPSGFPQARVVTLTETGTHSPVDARVGGYCAGEQELAVAMAGSAAGMRVIMDRVDGGEVVRLLTDLMDPAAFPAGELAALYHERWESESSFRQVKTFQRGPHQLRVRGPGAGAPGDTGASGGAPLPDPDHHAAGRPGADRPGPHLLHQGPQARAAQRHPPVCRDIRADQAVHGDDGREGPPQARQRRQAPAGSRPAPQAPGLEVLLPHSRPDPPAYPPGGRQGAHTPSRDSSQLTSNGIGSPPGGGTSTEARSRRCWSGPRWPCAWCGALRKPTRAGCTRRPTGTCGPAAPPRCGCPAGSSRSTRCPAAGSARPAGPRAAGGGGSSPARRDPTAGPR